MLILFASDHAGFEMKEHLIDSLHSLGYNTEDLGPYEYAPKDDYPDYVIPLARRIALGDAAAATDTPEVTPNPSTFGIIIGASGQGEAITANRFSNVRAAVFNGANEEIITLSREHNNANILSLGAKFITLENAKSAVKEWLKTPFSEDERHKRRLEKIEKLTQ